MTRIALIGDRDETVVAHRAIESSLNRLETPFAWVGTEQVGDASGLAPYGGLWCVPASPYRDMNGALRAIRYAREGRRPFFGTCGGFQHAVIEYARSVLGWHDAEHAETSPNAQRPVIAPLACALRGATEQVDLVPGSILSKAARCVQVSGRYQCSFGLNPTFATALQKGPLRVSARGSAREVRGVELEDSVHPFFVAVLFQPERDVLEGAVSPIVQAFVEAARTARRQTCPTVRLS